MEKQEKKTILDLICEINHSQYISDLRFIDFKEKVKKEILSIPNSTYTLQEWLEALNYVRSISSKETDINKIKLLLVNSNKEN